MDKYISTTMVGFLNEQLNNRIIAYHGTSSILPFVEFRKEAIGSGLVSNGNKYGGFFFTTEKENARYYTEWFIAKVEISNVIDNPLESTHPSTILDYATETNKNYKIDDILDGGEFSDIIVVPKTNISDINIIEWEFVGDEEMLYEKYDEFFRVDDDAYGDVSRDSVNDYLGMLDVELGDLLKIPVFKKYYNQIPEVS